MTPTKRLSGSMLSFRLRVSPGRSSCSSGHHVLRQGLFRALVEGEEIGVLEGHRVLELVQAHHHRRRPAVDVQVELVGGGQGEVELGHVRVRRQGAAAGQPGQVARAHVALSIVRVMRVMGFILVVVIERSDQADLFFVSAGEVLVSRRSLQSSLPTRAWW
jgi:hypothetical protein